MNEYYLLGEPAGLHPPYQQFYLRRIRFDPESPLIQIYETYNLEQEDDE